MIVYWITRWKGYIRYKVIRHRGNYLEIQEIFKAVIPNYFDGFADKEQAIADALEDFAKACIMKKIA